MDSIRVRKLALAVGVTVIVVYLGCALILAFLGREGIILFLNSLLHGLDVSPIIRMSVPWWETLAGAVEVFILGWLVGAVIAAIYNAGVQKAGKKGT